MSPSVRDRDGRERRVCLPAERKLVPLAGSPWRRRLPIGAVETFGLEHEVRLRQLESANDALEVAEARYEGGLTSFMEVLDLQCSRFNAELKASEALQLHHTSIVQLYKALGGGWSV